MPGEKRSQDSVKEEPGRSRDPSKRRLVPRGTPTEPTAAEGAEGVKRSSSFRFPTKFLKGFQISGQPFSFHKKPTANDNENDSVDSRTRSPSRYSRPTKRTASLSPSRSDETGMKGFLKVMPAPLINLFGRRRLKSASTERTVPMKPMRRPGPVGKTWVKMFDDIEFMDEISESEAPILGYTGYLTVVPDAQPLPKAPTPPPEKTNSEIVKADVLPERQKMDENDKENVLQDSKSSSATKSSRSREISRYKGKRQKRTGTPGSHDGMLANDLVDDQNTTEDDYIIPETVQPPRPARGHKIYETIHANKSHSDVINEKKEENPRMGVKLYEKFVIRVDNNDTTELKMPQVETEVPSKPKRGIKIYETIRISPQTNDTNSSTDDTTKTVNLDSRKCAEDDIIQKDPVQVPLTEIKDENALVPEKPTRKNRIYEKVKEINDTMKEDIRTKGTENNVIGAVLDVNNKSDAKDKMLDIKSVDPHEPKNDDVVEATKDTGNSLSIIENTHEASLTENNDTCPKISDEKINSDVPEKELALKDEFPVYSQVHKTNQIKSDDDLSSKPPPPPVPPKKRKFKEQQINNDVSYDILPPKPMRNVNNKITLPRKKSKKNHDFENTGNLNLNPFRNHQERPLPAPPRRKKPNEGDISQAISPTPPPKRKNAKQKCYPKLTEKENECTENAKNIVNESFLTSSENALERCGTDSAAIVDIESTLKNIENSFDTIDNVIKSLQKHASQRNLSSIEICESNACNIDKNTIKTNTDNNKSTDKSILITELPIQYSQNEISVFTFPEYESGGNPASVKIPGYFDSTSEIKEKNSDFTSSSENTPRAISPITTEPLILEPSPSTSTHTDTETHSNNPPCPESPVSIVSYYSVASHVSPSENSECSTPAAYYSAVSESGAESPPPNSERQ